MRALNEPASAPAPTLHLGLPGFSFEDLYRPCGLRRLAERFDAQLQGDAPDLFQAFDAYRKSGGTTPSGPAESDLLIQVARHVSRFVATLFGIGTESERLARHLRGELPLFDFK